MASYKLYCLGPPILEMDGKPVKLETRKSLALLVYLRMAEHDYSRETLSTLFWQEYDQQHAQANLRRSLSSLNSSFQKELLESDREKIGLIDRSKVWLDIEKFQELRKLSQIHQHPDGQFCEECLLYLQEAKQLYRGDFLEGFNLPDSPEFDEWQFLQRENLRQDFTLVLQKIAQSFAAQSKWDAAIEHARRWLTFDRLHEPANRLLMDLLARSDQRTAALRQYKELSHLLEEQLGQQPGLETNQLFEQIRGQVQSIKKTETPVRISSFPLIKTKLYIPVPPTKRVSRLNLLDRLDEVDQKALTIISAPAGYGKTTLLAEWIAKTSMPVAWLSIDGGDNDPHRFLAYVIAALGSIQEDIGCDACQFMQSNQPVPLYAVLASLINDLGKIQEPYVLILDDYQFITEQNTHEALIYLLDHRPATLHVVIASRVDPPLQLGRLRAYNRLLELRLRDLRFSYEEETAFLNHIMHLGLPAMDIQALDARTEGWIAGLQMAALSLEGRKDPGEFIQSFTGSHRYVLDYLTEEVLKRQPAHIQTFLLETSILERMNSSLCDVLLDEEWKRSSEGGQTVLEFLEKANLFLIPLDDHRHWYRYHHLFAELLHARLLQNNPRRAEILHQRAAVWHEQNDVLSAAVQHALASRNYDLAADIIERAYRAGKFLSYCHKRMILAWMNSIPDSVLRRKLDILIYTSRTCFANGQLNVGEQLIHKAQEYLESPETDPAEKARLFPIYASTYALFTLQHGKVKVTVDFINKALAQLSSDDFVVRIISLITQSGIQLTGGNVRESERLATQALAEAQDTDIVYLEINSAYYIARAQLAQGKLESAAQICERAIQKGLSGEIKNPITGIAQMTLGEIYFSRNQLLEAKQVLLDGLDILKSGGVTDDFGRGHATLALVMQALGDPEGAKSAIQYSTQVAEICNIPRITWLASAYQARVGLAQGNQAQAVRWAEEYTSLEPAEYLREFEDLTLAEIFLACGRVKEAMLLLDCLLASARSEDRMGAVIESLVLQAQAYQTIGNQHQAFEKLADALVLAEPEGYIHIFCRNAQIMQLLKLGYEQGKWESDTVNVFATQLLKDGELVSA